MRKNYILSFVGLLGLFITNSMSAQVTTIYNTTHAATTGAEINATANGLGTKMGDAILLGGTARQLNEITVDLFHLTSVAPYTLTMSLYTDCPSGAAGCGSGPGTLIPNSQLSILVTPTVAIGTKYNVTFSYALAGVDLSSETDNGIVVMLNASRNDVFWFLNETPVTGSAPAGETATSVVIRCGSTVAANNGCTRAFTGAINNFAMNVTATPSLSVRTQQFADSFSVYPNPVNNFVKISSEKISELKSIKIYDFTGRIVKTVPVSSPENDMSIDLSNLSSGNYLMKMESDSGVAVKKIAKN